jgi:hypothetical protein
MPENNRFSQNDYLRVPPRRPRKPYRPFRTAALLLLLTVLMGAVAAVAAGGVWALSRRYLPQATTAVKPRAVTARGDLAADEQSTIELFRAVSPSVVHVTNLAATRDRYSRDVYTVPRGTGTGFIWDEQGHIVTNFHVIDGASAVRVVLADGSRYDTNRVWGDPEQDLAVIQIDAAKAKLRPIAVGTSHDLQVGQRAQSADRVGERPADPRRHPDQRRDQPGQLRRSASGQRRPAHRRQHGHRQSVGGIGRHRLRHPGGRG